MGYLFLFLIYRFGSSSFGFNFNQLAHLFAEGTLHWKINFIWFVGSITVGEGIQNVDFFSILLLGDRHAAGNEYGLSPEVDEFVFDLGGREEHEIQIHVR